jgi:predicted enzyme related to lactoylglutathione lyase
MEITMDNFLGIIPHIPSKNMARTVDFMSEALEFTPQPNDQEVMEFYREIRLGDYTIGILKSEGEPNQQSIYLHVSDVDSLWESIGSKLQKTGATPPFDQEYGMREVHVIIPETNTLLMIGSQMH